MCKPTYSIIIPHHHIPDLLMRCLRSIPVSEDIQVIVVDDNSPDADTYLERYPELSRPYLEFVRTTKGGGAGYARNVGLTHAKGKWLLFADADDFYVDDFADILEEYAEDDADMIYFNTKGVFSDEPTRASNRNKDYLFEEYQKDGDINIFRYRYKEPWGKIYSAKLVRDHAITFDETQVANDYMFSVMTGVYGNKIKAVNRPIYIVVVRENSLSSKMLDTKRKLMDRFYVQARVQVFLQQHGYCKDEMMIFKFAVNMCHRYPFLFISKLFWLSRLGINVRELIWMILTERVFAPSKRARLNVNRGTYI